MSTECWAGEGGGRGARPRSLQLPPIPPRFFFLARGEEPTDLTNQWLEWEATELQVGAPGFGGFPPPGPALPDPFSASFLLPQPAASAALYAQLVHGRKGLEAVEVLGKLLAHIEQNLSRRGTAYLAGVSGAVGWGEHCLLGGPFSLES